MNAGRLPEHAPEFDMAPDAPLQPDRKPEATDEQTPEHGADVGRGHTHDDNNDDLIPR